MYYTDAFVPEEPYVVPFGKARVCTSGDDITIVGISNMLVECLRAHEILADIGIHAEVIDPISLVPLDIDTIVRFGQQDRPPAGGRQRLDELRRERRNRRAGGRARSGRQADRGPAHGLCADHVSDHAGAGAGVLSRSRQDRASRFYAMVRPGADAWQPDPERAKLAYQVKFRGPF